MPDDPARPQPDPDKPIANFSQCHVGILTHLDAFAGLPALLDPATQARQIAKDMLGFFRHVVYDHHAEEERVLAKRLDQERSA